jgi:hypothetical protein
MSDFKDIGSPRGAGSALPVSTRVKIGRALVTPVASGGPAAPVAWWGDTIGAPEPMVTTGRDLRRARVPGIKCVCCNVLCFIFPPP